MAHKKFFGRIFYTCSRKSHESFLIFLKVNAPGVLKLMKSCVEALGGVHFENAKVRARLHRAALHFNCSRCIWQKRKISEELTRWLSNSKVTEPPRLLLERKLTAVYSQEATCMRPMLDLQVDMAFLEWPLKRNSTTCPCWSVNKHAKMHTLGKFIFSSELKRYSERAPQSELAQSQHR